MTIMKNHHHHHHPHFHTPKLEASVGLAIVAALHLKPSNTGGEILINHIVLSSPRSDPIPVITNNNNNMMVDDEDEDENYTYVTSRGAANPVTRVYHHRPTGDGGCVVTTLKPLMYSKVEDQTSNKNIDNNDNSNELSNFLSSCDMCRKNLAGKDIYMYRGEKAFCSEECRHRQIASDEREEKLCRRRPSKTTSSVSRSPCYYETGHIFSTGIISIY